MDTENANTGSQTEEQCSFLTLSNRSRLPGKLPFLPDRKKRMLPTLWKRLFAWISRKPLDDGEENKYSSYWKYIEWVLVAAITAVIFTTISVRSLRGKLVLGMSLLKSEVFLLMAIGCRLVSAVVVGIIVRVLHKLFRYSDGFLYVVYKVQGIFKWTVIAWILLAAWEIIYGELQGILDSKVMTMIEKVLIDGGIVLSLWFVKSILVMSLASWFYMHTYYEKVSDSLFYRYVVEALMGLPLIEYRRYLPIETSEALRDLHKLNPKDLSSWHMKQMMIEKKEGIALRIKTEDEAKREAERIFQNVAKPSSQFIDLEDLKRFLPTDEALKTLNIFRSTYEDDVNIQISLVFLQEWMVHSFKRDRSLLLSLRDMDNASKIIGTIFNILFGGLLVAISIPLLELGGVKYLASIGTSAFILTFLFGQTWKDHYSAIQLLYIRHPFDVGDEVEIEEKEMVVEKLNVLSTDFVGRDNKKRTMGNAGICDKLVTNNTRSELPAWTTENLV
ncbi:unnamed protein product [Arabidopsis arenosa]|uniref:Mechanosensitive ion channel MscS domain-containing protein n=1 Tax=Arabidopsis arenosa TaxID=38785 RepID=A0A8S1ZEA2_ARAAE|nr:unnamed protein product [Arabidopsis arenosa]